MMPLVQNVALKRQVARLEKQLGDPRVVVEKVLGKGIAWFDMQEATKNNRQKYYAEAQQILNSEVFNNLINFLIATQCQEQVRQYSPQMTHNPIRDVQMMINAFELLREELASVVNPAFEPEEKTSDEVLFPHSLT